MDKGANKAVYYCNTHVISFSIEKDLNIFSPSTIRHKMRHALMNLIETVHSHGQPSVKRDNFNPQFGITKEKIKNAFQLGDKRIAALKKILLEEEAGKINQKNIDYLKELRDISSKNYLGYYSYHVFQDVGLEELEKYKKIIDVKMENTIYPKAGFKLVDVKVIKNEVQLKFLISDPLWATIFLFEKIEETLKFYPVEEKLSKLLITIQSISILFLCKIQRACKVLWRQQRKLYSFQKTLINIKKH